jgi:hypothetical protein
MIAPMQPASDLHYRSICVTKALKSQPKNAGEPGRPRVGATFGAAVE